MSSDSDSEDDAKIKQFLEAADPILLNNSMFQKKQDKLLSKDCTEAVSNHIKDVKTELPKSQRYLIEDSEISGVDFSLPESMQKHLRKKFNEILEKHYEFYDATENNSTKIKTKHKSRVKLLRGDDCFVSPYEEQEYDIKGPTKKPLIKRRIVDKADQNVNEHDLKLIAIDGDFILSGQEVTTWAKKKERKDKIFHYKMSSSGVLHAKEEITEFNKIRNKNKWNESKIKTFKKT